MDVFISKIKLLNTPCIFENFRSVRAKLLQKVSCRPVVACTIAKLCQVTKVHFNSTKDPIEAKKIISHLHKYKIKLKYPKLDIETLHIRTYADSSHANNDDLSTQLGFLVCLCDSKNNVHKLLVTDHTNAAELQDLLWHRSAMHWPTALIIRFQ